MKSAEIRQAFLDFFQSKQHQIVASSSLVPGNDPTLLFTNAGMVQFKDVFLGEDKRSYSRATSSQRCVRAGGKHNDLENVGYTARHHTFFEMLGNFSFGDYFKREAISFAWEFLTSKEWLGIPSEKLMVTVYQEDDEAFDIWHKEMSVPAEKIVRIGDKGGRYQSDNFWSMGDTGPCGPCTEIFYDHGEEIWGGPPGSPEEDGDRFIEIWNVVFMQFNRSADGVMAPLPKPSVDTGMGLERIAAVMQNVHSNYEIDLFQYLLAATAKATNTSDMENKSLRVIADHIRSCAFLVVDGVIPANEGRGYVLRRIIRRAIRHGHKLGQKDAFFHSLVQALVDQMGEAYPELKQQQAQIEKILLTEEQQFEKTLDKGMAVLESELANLNAKEIPGQLVFTLYDTYGFPVDLTNDIARERVMSIDLDGYEKLMEEQRQRARAAGSFKVDYNDNLEIDGETEFTGYEDLAGSSTVIALFKGGQSCEQLEAGERGIVVLSETPFYAESGGQVGDQGLLKAEGLSFSVEDCAKQGNNHLHIGELTEGQLSLGQKLSAEVVSGKRQATALNHSATHLLHAALRKVLGDHVTQKGSLVDPERLRFDFSHFEAVTAEELKAIEAMVNEQIRANTPVQTDVCDMETAKSKGAMALFGEKYGDSVRVLSMGTEQFSVELCGGTHVERTGDIGLLRITSESGIAAGVRRIEAVTGRAAVDSVDTQQAQLQDAAKLLKTKPEELVNKLQSLLDQQKTLEKELKAAKAKLASAASGDLLGNAVEVQGVKVLAVQLSDVDHKSLRDTVDQFKNKLGSSVIIVAVVDGQKISLVAGVSKDLVGQFKAGDLMKHVATQVGGKGGGRPDMAQGGGDQPENLDAALASVQEWVASQI
ncbi:alanine--tRNA ligase [uncultured Pseudoteredinibacter sp.]|uniref:alanine--tRNA ligase n=1 Tax=uncultured Pseudoteredinibacter sp. TaxID=1641701 RepID=UPI00261A21FD|nr:alanine--tRNA ligase [uncultured Pseudoteredinibacter sp.]